MLRKSDGSGLERVRWVPDAGGRGEGRGLGCGRVEVEEGACWWSWALAVRGVARIRWNDEDRAVDCRERVRRGGFALAACGEGTAYGFRWVVSPGSYGAGSDVYRARVAV